MKMEQEPIFSNEIPMPPGKELRRKAQAAPCEVKQKPKRKYTRKAPEIPPPPQTDRERPETGLSSTIPEARIASFGMEYIQALTTLLALIGEPQRAKLVEFIIQERII